MGARPIARTAALTAAFALLAHAPVAGARGASSPPGCAGGLAGAIDAEESVPALSTPVDPAATASFSVLRRPLGPQDALPPLNPLEEDVHGELAGYYPETIRQLLALPDGKRFFVIVGLPHVISLPPARCLPPQLRKQRKAILEQQLVKARQPAYCVVTVGGPASPFLDKLFEGDSCLPLQSVYEAAGIVSKAFSSSAVVDLVPDGVASVRLIYRDGISLTAAVSEDAYQYTPPPKLVERAKRLLIEEVKGTRKHPNKAQRRRERAHRRALKRAVAALAPTQVLWLDAAGQALRTIDPKGSPGAGGLLGFILGEG